MGIIKFRILESVLLLFNIQSIKNCGSKHEDVNNKFNKILEIQQEHGKYIAEISGKIDTVIDLIKK